MKIEKQELIEQDSIGQFNEIASSIRTEDLGLAFDMVSRNLYSNPIGSFVREIVSNAVDANFDNPLKKLVNVHIYKEGEQHYFTVRDYGIGMNPERFGAYMQWFNSDKRDTNNKIGGWGLGSKSPLAYAEYYYVDTICDGIKYSYVIARQNPVPTATLLSTEYTNEESGTLIKIEIEENDLWNLHLECENQLLYFDNIYVKDESYFYDNNFTIYDSKDFRLRNNKQPFGANMHICLGQVAYPINWEILNLKPIKIPVALKFNIGDLPVTLSREEIDYKKADLKQIIVDKAKKVEEYLLNLYEESLKVDNIQDLLSGINNISNKKLIIGDVSIDMSSYEYKRIHYTPLDLFISKHQFKTTISRLYNVANFKNGLLEKDTYYDAFDVINQFSYNGYISEHRFNKWDLKFADSGYILTYRDYKKDLKNLATVLKLIDIKKKKRIYYGYDEIHSFKFGATIKIYKFVKDIHAFVTNLLNNIDNSAPSDWIEEQKAAEREYNESRKEIIICYNAYNNREEINLGELLDSSPYILYLDKKEDINIKKAYTQLFDILPKHYKQKLRLVIIPKTSINRIKRFKDKVMPVEHIWKIKNLSKFYRRIYITNLIEVELSACYNLFAFSNYYNKIYITLRNRYDLNLKISHYVTKYNVEYTNIYDEFKEQIHQNMYKDSLIYEHYIDILKSITDRLEIVNIVYIHDKNTILKNTILKNTIKKLKLLRFNQDLY